MRLRIEPQIDPWPTSNVTLLGVDIHVMPLRGSGANTALRNSIHPDEALLIEFRERQQTSQGRTRLRERVAVEHTLARVGRWQGRQARYRGVRKNLFDLRRCAVVHNLHVLGSFPATLC